MIIDMEMNVIKASADVPHQMDAGVAKAPIHGTFDESVLPSLEDENFVISLGRYYVIAPFLIGQRVLDVACGKGQGAAMVCQQPAMLIQQDLCFESLLFGRRYFPSPVATAVNGDCLTLPFADRSFDAVIAFEIIEHIEPARTTLFLSEIKRVLRPGGRAFVSTPNHAVVLSAGTYIPPYHINNLRPGQFARVLRPHFRRVRLYGYFRRQSWGRDALKLFDVFNLRHALGRSFTAAVKLVDGRAVVQTSACALWPAHAQTEVCATASWWDGREVPSCLARYRLSRWYTRQAGHLMAVCDV